METAQEARPVLNEAWWARPVNTIHHFLQVTVFQISLFGDGQLFSGAGWLTAAFLPAKDSARLSWGQLQRLTESFQKRSNLFVDRVPTRDLSRGPRTAETRPCFNAMD